MLCTMLHTLCTNPDPDGTFPAHTHAQPLQVVHEMLVTSEGCCWLHKPCTNFAQTLTLHDLCNAHCLQVVHEMLVTSEGCELYLLTPTAFGFSEGEELAFAEVQEVRYSAGLGEHPVGCQVVSTHCGVQVPSGIGRVTERGFLAFWQAGFPEGQVRRGVS